MEQTILHHAWKLYYWKKKSMYSTDIECNWAKNKSSRLISTAYVKTVARVNVSTISQMYGIFVDINIAAAADDISYERNWIKTMEI